MRDVLSIPYAWPEFRQGSDSVARKLETLWQDTYLEGTGGPLQTPDGKVNWEAFLPQYEGDLTLILKAMDEFGVTPMPKWWAKRNFAINWGRKLLGRSPTNYHLHIPQSSRDTHRFIHMKVEGTDPRIELEHGHLGWGDKTMTRMRIEWEGEGEIVLQHLRGQEDSRAVLSFSWHPDEAHFGKNPDGGEEVQPAVSWEEFLAMKMRYAFENFRSSHVGFRNQRGVWDVLGAETEDDGFYIFVR